MPNLRFADARRLGATFYSRAALNQQKVLGVSTRLAEVYVNLVNIDDAVCAH